jgi:hypothetical protein
MKGRLTEKHDGASNSWKFNPVTSSCPWRFGKVSSLDMHKWTCYTRTIYQTDLAMSIIKNN